ncbi:MAG TPA: hypothetical protein VFN56_00505 [Candidatus Saccharimonadales bacterium]|nr:hypothetical protein [Candidatus Saccharimonadales bacterium]
MATKKVPKAKKGAWFVPVRGSYLPASWQGWASYIPFTAYLVFTLIAGWHDTHKTSTAILFIVPNWVAATAVMTWVAKRTS